MLMFSWGFLIRFLFSFRRLKATASEIGPTRPKYIVSTIISLPQRLSDEVRFRERPTVAAALTVSKITSVKDAEVTALKASVEIKTVAKLVAVTARAFPVAPEGKVRLKTETLLRFLRVDQADKSRTAKVTVLMPPAVPTGEPPMNIKSRVIMQDGFVRFCWGIVKKPAVLVVTDWKRQTVILSPKLKFLMVRGLLYSKMK